MAKIISVIVVWLSILIIPWGSSFAHEAWLQPTEYKVQKDGVVKVDVMAGEDFAGHRLSYNPVRFSRLQFSLEGVTGELTGRLGDLPAVQFAPGGEGLHTIVYQTTGSEITYKSAEQFETFAIKEGVDWVLDSHRQRNLPRDGFKETFYRYCKTLVGVGHSRGADQSMDMPYELVALQNPVTGSLEQLTLQLLWQGSAEPGLLSVYRKSADDRVTLDTFSINENGQVTIPLMDNSRYLLNAVKMRAIEAASEEQPVWESHWASLTFATTNNL